MPRPLPPAERTERLYPTPDDAADALAAESVIFLRERIAKAGLAKVVLTGGSSPVGLYRRWARDYAEAIDWSQVHFFWGDERVVPLDHDDSNAKLCTDFLDTLGALGARRHTWRVDLNGADAVRAMAVVLEANRATGPYAFDLVLLGIGPDGHVASLFPPDKPWRDLDEDEPTMLRHITDSPKPPAERLTFTLPLLNRARRVCLLAFGKGKRVVVEQLRVSDRDITASYVAGAERTELWTDLG